MQAVKTTIQEAVHGAELLVSRLKSLRNESEFHSFYEKCVRKSHNLTDEPQLPRYRKNQEDLMVEKIHTVFLLQRIDIDRLFLNL